MRIHSTNYVNYLSSQKKEKGNHLSMPGLKVDHMAHGEFMAALPAHQINLILL